MSEHVVLLRSIIRRTLQEKYVKDYHKGTHQVGMRVPKGGSMCANCKFISNDGTKCVNKEFQSWNNDQGRAPETLPAPADEYCCDFWSD